MEEVIWKVKGRTGKNVGCRRGRSGIGKTADGVGCKTDDNTEVSRYDLLDNSRDKYEYTEAGQEFLQESGSF